VTRGACVSPARKKKVGDLPAAQQPVVIVSSKDTLEQGFQKLSDANILSAPVWSEETHKYTGFLDMRDLVSSVVFIADQATSATTKTLSDLFVNAKWVGGAFSVTYLSRRNPFKSVKASDSLLSVAELLANKASATKVKRVAVVDDAGVVTGIVSQTTLVAFLAKQIAEHHAHLGRTVEQLNLGNAPVVSVSENAPALEAFRLMDARHINGLAIVSDNGRLTGNISVRDLKLFVKHIDFDRLLQPVGEFVKQLRQSAIDIMSPTITVFPSATYDHVVGKLAATKGILVAVICLSCFC
jgi:CBS domain-containing protein